MQNVPSREMDIWRIVYIGTVRHDIVIKYNIIIIIILRSVRNRPVPPR